MRIEERVEQCACFNLRKAARTVTQIFDDVLQPSGLRATQFTVLAAAAVSGSVFISDLARELVMDRTTLTRNLKPLEKRGWVEILPGEDRRTRSVILTKEGRRVLKKAVPYWKRAQDRVVKQLTPKRWRSLLVHLSETASLAR